MSKVTVIFESTKEDDGVGTVTSYQQGGIEDLSQLAWVFSEAARAGGYTYVESVCFELDDGKLVWSDV